MTVVATGTAELKVLAGAADKRAMLSPTLQFDVTPTQQQLLHAYQAQAASLKVTTEEFDGWLERIDELSGVDVDQLTGLHGQLIASGMLKFEISGRSVGLKYQLSQQGKKALEVTIDTDDQDSLELEHTEQDTQDDDDDRGDQIAADAEGSDAVVAHADVI